MWLFDESVIWLITKSVIFVWLAIVSACLLFHISRKSKRIIISFLLCFGAIIVFCFFIFLVISLAETFIVTLLVSLPSLSIYILLVFTERFTLRSSKGSRILNSAFLHYAVGCVISFLFTLLVLGVVAELKFKSNVSTLSQSNSLVLRTAIYRRGFPALPWEKEVNDLQTIKKLSSILAGCRYQLTYVPGLLATTDWIEVHMYRDGKKLGLFGVISSDLDLGFISIKYVTDEPSRTLHELLRPETDIDLSLKALRNEQ